MTPELLTAEDLDFMHMVDDAMNEVDDLEVTFHDASRLTSEELPYLHTDEGITDDSQTT